MAINDFLGEGELVQTSARTAAGRRTEERLAQRREDQALSQTEQANIDPDLTDDARAGRTNAGQDAASPTGVYQDSILRQARLRGTQNTVSPATESNTSLPSQNQPTTRTGGISSVSTRPYLLMNPRDDRYDFRTGQKVFTESNASAALSATRGLGVGIGANVNTPQGHPDPDSFDPRGRDQIPSSVVNTPTYEPVEPRPEGLTSEERIARAEWDQQYRLTHRRDGQPLTQFDSGAQ